MFEVAVTFTTLLCGLVAGLVFAFAVVAMPGIKSLPDREFIRAFQVMDRIIQNNQPLFLIVWVGSALGVIVTAVIGVTQLEGLDLGLLLVATAVYLIGVQLPTATINIPLNNALQQVDVFESGEQQLAEARAAFEPRWNQWNRIRTALAVVSTLLLLVLLVRL